MLCIMVFTFLLKYENVYKNTQNFAVSKNGLTKEKQQIIIIIIIIKIHVLSSYIFIPLVWVC